jgi:glycosyltransferase involved in cell wall biosynthesis
MNGLLDGHNLARGMGEHGRRAAVDRYDWRRVVEDLVKIYGQTHTGLGN